MWHRLIIILIFCFCTQNSICLAENNEHNRYVQHVEQAFQMLFQGNNKGAITEFENALNIEPEHFEILHYLGMAYANQESLNKAIDAYQRSLTLNPENIEALYSLGVVYFKLNQWDNCTEPLQKVITLDPVHGRGFELLGKVFVKLRKYKEAVPTLTQAIKLKPFSAGIYNELGTAYLNLKEYQKAIENFNNAIQYGPPNYADPHHGLGTAYLRLGDREKSRKEMQIFQQMQKQYAEYERYTRLTRNEPENLDGWTGLAQVLMSQRQYNEVIPVLQKCIQLATQQQKPAEAVSGYHHGISQAFIQLNYPRPAQEYVQKAIKLQPNIPVYYNTLGSTFAMQGNVPNAIGAFRKAIELDSEQPLFHLNISKLYQSIGQQKLAQEHYKTYEYHLEKQKK